VRQLPNRSRMLVVAVSCLVTAAALVWFAGCGGRSGDGDASAPAAVAEAPAGAPDILLLLVAGLRADPPGRHGAEAAFFDEIPGTPVVRFPAAYAQSASPLISLGTILTGRYASAIPMCGTFVGSATASSEGRAWCADIPADRHTLPEVLGLYGYRTALVTGGSPEMEVVADEFQTWIDVPIQGPEAGVDWETLRERIRTWWSQDESRPRLLVVLADDMTRDAVPRMQSELGAGQRFRRGVSGAYEDIPAADRQKVAAIYEQAATDAGRPLGELLSGLSTGQSPRPWWAFVGSTNGVNLLETTGFNQEPVYPFDAGMVLDRTVHVPLAVYSDGGAPLTRSADGLCELRSLFSTAIQLGGGEVPAGMSGVDLLAAGYAGEERVYTEFGDMLGLRKGNHMVVFRGFLHDGNTLDPELDRRLKDQAMIREPDHYVLHDVVADPFQERDLFKSASSTFLQLRDELIEVRTTHAAVPAEALTPERLWELRMSPSQGYW